MTPSELQKLFAKDKEEKHSLSLGQGFVEYIARESNNKYDRGIKFSGINAADKARLQVILDNSEFDKTLVRVGSKLSKNGKGYALVSYLVNGQPFLD